MNKERIIYILVIALLLGFIIFQQRKDNTKYSYITTTTIDTLYIRDSIIIKEPQYITKYITHTVIDTLYSVDSVMVPVHIPIETAIYQDSTSIYSYRAIVSGYKPQLDELNIYTLTPSYNTTTTITKKVKPKFSLSMGASYQPFNNRIEPSINIGYNIFSW